MSSRNEALTLEDRLCKLADKINKEIGKGTNADNGCSIYLYDYRSIDQFQLINSDQFLINS